MIAAFSAIYCLALMLKSTNERYLISRRTQRLSTDSRTGPLPFALPGWKTPRQPCSFPCLNDTLSGTATWRARCKPHPALEKSHHVSDHQFGTQFSLRTTSPDHSQPGGGISGQRFLSSAGILEPRRMQTQPHGCLPCRLTCLGEGC